MRALFDYGAGQGTGEEADDNPADEIHVRHDRLLLRCGWLRWGTPRTDLIAVDRS
jgi:hypothetical protein